MEKSLFHRHCAVVKEVELCLSQEGAIKKKQQKNNPAR